jgi:hypothetical protein
MEEIILDIDEANTLDFKVKVEGTNASSTSARLVCECGDVSYVFKGHVTNEDDIVRFEIPKMSDKVKVGLYECNVEVFVENRYFVPATFTANFKKTMSVVAEVIKRSVTQPKKQEITVTAESVKTKIANIDKKLSCRV